MGKVQKDIWSKMAREAEAEGRYVIADLLRRKAQREDESTEEPEPSLPIGSSSEGTPIK